MRPFRLLAILESIVERIPEKRRRVVFAISEVRLRVDRYELVSAAEEVVVVEVAVDEPARRRHELGEQLAREGKELAPLPLGAIEPTGDLWNHRPERRSRRPPKPRCDADREGRRLVLREPGNVTARHGALFQKRAARAADQPNRAVAVPELERVALVQRLIVSFPRD